MHPGALAAGTLIQYNTIHENLNQGGQKIQHSQTMPIEKSNVEAVPKRVTKI